MTIDMTFILGAIFVGIFATLVMDLWALFLKRAFNIHSLNYCLVGRWLRHMPDGTFKHANIASAQPRRAECTVGWVAHYAIGVIFALVLVVLTSGSWLQHPTPVPALLFGLGTVAVPFFIMQPSFGLGIAASRTPQPTQARLRSLATHAVFGCGLYLGAVLLGQVFRAHG